MVVIESVDKANPLDAFISHRHKRFEDLPRNARVLDVGAGTGEFSAKVADHLPESQVLGIELAGAFKNVVALAADGTTTASRTTTAWAGRKRGMAGLAMRSAVA